MSDGGTPTGSAGEATPVFRVVRGDPTDEELAALLAVVATSGGPAAVSSRRTTEWNAPRRLPRANLRRGPGAWRRSGLPG